MFDSKNRVCRCFWLHNKWTYDDFLFFWSGACHPLDSSSPSPVGFDFPLHSIAYFLCISLIHLKVRIKNICFSHSNSESPHSISFIVSFSTFTLSFIIDTFVIFVTVYRMCFILFFLYNFFSYVTLDFINFFVEISTFRLTKKN